MHVTKRKREKNSFLTRLTIIHETINRIRERNSRIKEKKRKIHERCDQINEFKKIKMPYMVYYRINCVYNNI